MRPRGRARDGQAQAQAQTRWGLHNARGRARRSASARDRGRIPRLIPGLSAAGRRSRRVTKTGPETRERTPTGVRVRSRSLAQSFLWRSFSSLRRRQAAATPRTPAGGTRAPSLPSGACAGSRTCRLRGTAPRTFGRETWAWQGRHSSPSSIGLPPCLRKPCAIPGVQDSLCHGHGFEHAGGVRLEALAGRPVEAVTPTGPVLRDGGGGVIAARSSHGCMTARSIAGMCSLTAIPGRVPGDTPRSVDRLPASRGNAFSGQQHRSDGPNPRPRPIGPAHRRSGLSGALLTRDFRDDRLRT